MKAKTIVALLLVFCLAFGMAACTASSAEEILAPKVSVQEEGGTKPDFSELSKSPDSEISTEQSNMNGFDLDMDSLTDGNSVLSAAEIASSLQQAVMQVYANQPDAPNDAFASVANYLETHPELCEAYLLFDDFSVSIYALDEAGGYQFVLFRTEVYQMAYLQYRPEQGVCEIVPAAPVEAVECAPEINALVEDSQVGASYEYIYYELCTADDEKAAFEEHLRAAQNAFKLHLVENWTEYADQSESLRAMFSLAVDYTVIFELYDGDTCVATLHYLPGVGLFTDKSATLDSFTATEQIPTLSEPQGGTKAAEALLLLDTQQYGPITASYYWAAQELDVWDARRALLGTLAADKPIQMDVPADLDFVPFRTISAPSASSLLICKKDGDADDAPLTYYLYDGENLNELTVLNHRSFGMVSPAHVRWRSDDELAYDVEDPKTGSYTTYLYELQTQKETVLLSDYAPFPFYAEDTIPERYLLVADTYALRIRRGGGVFLRQLPDGDEIVVTDLQTPDTAYFHMTPLSRNTVVYFSADETSHFTTLAFLDRESGLCAKLERPASDELSEQSIMLLDESTIAIPVTTRTAMAEQTYLFVYSFSK